MQDDLKREVKFPGTEHIIDEKDILNQYRSLIDVVTDLCADTMGASPVGVAVIFAEEGPSNSTYFSVKTRTRKKDSERRLQDIMHNAMMEWVKEEFGEGMEIEAKKVSVN